MIIIIIYCFYNVLIKTTRPPKSGTLIGLTQYLLHVRASLDYRNVATFEIRC